MTLEDWLLTFVSLGLTATGFMVAAASFLAGQYLSESRKLGIERRLNFFLVLILSLLFVPLCLTILNSVSIGVSSLAWNIKSILLTITLSPLVPIIVILAILLKEPKVWARRG